jgi:hypothetical protein
MQRKNRVLAYAGKNLPQKGVLRQAENGFLYVKLPKEYIFNTLPLIRKDLNPPPYFAAGLVGAHITVATAEEMAAINFPKVLQLGKWISFELVSLARVEVEQSLIGKEIYCFTVASQQLIEIRAELGLPENPYDFHITIGVK